MNYMVPSLSARARSASAAQRAGAFVLLALALALAPCSAWAANVVHPARCTVCVILNTKRGPLRYSFPYPTAHRGDARGSPPRPRPKSLAGGPLAILEV